MGDLEAFLDGGTTTALFVLDALAPLTDDALRTATDALVTQLTRLGPDVHVARRLPAAPRGPGA